ncbi:MAG: peptidylprolyl isomerase [Bacteroides sp.]|nr:peptidylprolyl isomerase [Bacteroides sp.]
MPRKFTGVLICLLVSVIGWAQGESAFVRAEEYRTKVELAKAFRMDTLAAFRMQWTCYAEVLRPGVEAPRKKTLAERGEWIKIAVITRRLAQHASASMEMNERRRMDSIYTALQGGASFETMAVRYSDDAYAGKPKRIPWVYLPDEWKECLSLLKKGEISRPFCSPQGIHILCWTERGSGEEAFSAVSQTNTEELRDALLAALLEKKYRTSVAYTEKELEKWFDTHRKAYAWDLPHYKGVVVHCRDKKEAKRIRKRLKKLDYEQWQSLAASTSSQDVRMECGLFRIGANPYVDKLVFKCGSYEPLEGLPYIFVLGKTLKKGPGDYRDIRERVLKDYREAHRNDWLEALKPLISQKE